MDIKRSWICLFLIALALPIVMANDVIVFPGYETGASGDFYGTGAPGAPTLSLVVNQRLYPQIRDAVDQYYQDLRFEGYRVLVHLRPQDMTAQELRALLVKDWKEQQSAGAFLVGNLAAAWYEEKTAGVYPYALEYYFSDLSGEWLDEDADGWFDGHKDADHGPEIYIGRLKADNLGGSEVQLIRDYFARNHLYRRGKNTIPQRVVNFSSALKRSQRLEAIYGNANLVEYENLGSRDFLRKFDGEQGEVVHLLAHGWTNGFSFEADKGSVTSLELAAVRKNYQFFLMHSCSVGDFTVPLNAAGVMLLVNSAGLNAFTVTKSAGAYWFDNYFAANFLNQDMSTGAALFTFNSLYADDDIATGDEGEFSLLGDPTLKLSRYYPQNMRRTTAPAAAQKTTWLSFNNDYAYSPESMKKYGAYYDIHYANTASGGASGWGHYKDRSFNDYLGDIHATLKADDFVLFTFYGSAVEFYTETAPEHGSLAVWSDRKYVNTYPINQERKGQVLLYKQAWDVNGYHQVMIKNARPDFWGAVDYFRVKVNSK